MCLDARSSNGTLIVAGAGLPARAAPAASSSKQTAAVRFMLEALPGGHDDLPVLAAAVEREPDRLARGHPGDQAVHLGAAADLLVFHPGDAVALAQAGL